ncbi:AlpA family transcriptional regulator [Nevskia sp.]|uniref:helix-turn-helix transcriptional regulator n=1 Tax=Nevskia sp. TaxID=1929292 RepID=UPI0025D4A95D|nr:AlpA family phage regulatory protein [Nevskia sp.]
MVSQHKQSLLRRDQVELRTGLSRSSLYALVQSGEFPAPIELNGRSRAWIESEVDTWIAGKIEAARPSDLKRA